MGDDCELFLGNGKVHPCTGPDDPHLLGLCMGAQLFTDTISFFRHLRNSYLLVQIAGWMQRGLGTLAIGRGRAAVKSVASVLPLGAAGGMEVSRGVEKNVRSRAQLRTPGSAVVVVAAAEGYMPRFTYKSAAYTDLGGGIARTKQVVVAEAQAGFGSRTPAVQK